MIISKDIHPESDLYFLGAHLINFLPPEGEGIGFEQLFRSFSNEIKISQTLFSLSLDWLFLLGVVQADGKGKIVRCS